MKIVVTGSAGFIGSHVVEELTSHGHEVVEFDVEHAAAEDITQEWMWIPPADCVIHLAAKPGVSWSIDRPAACMGVNVVGTVNVLESARRAGIRNFVFASSSTVYGGLSPYGISKRCGEELCERYARLYGMNVSALRLFSVYGPRMRKDLAMVKMADATVPGRAPFAVRGDPSLTLRDYTYVKDVAKAFRLAAERAANAEESSFEVFDVCGGCPRSLNEVKERLELELGAEVRTVDGGPTPAWEPKVTHGNYGPARIYIGWEPTTEFDDGVEKFVEWWKSCRA